MTKNKGKKGNQRHIQDEKWGERVLNVLYTPSSSSSYTSNTNTIHKHQLLGTEYIFQLQGVLTPRECSQLISITEKQGFQLSSQKATPEMAFRRNGRLQITNESIANSLFLRIAPFLPKVAHKKLKLKGLNPNIRFYQYQPGDGFGRHIDESVRYRDSVSLFTVLFYLNEDIQGGHTVFYDDDKEDNEVLRYIPERGSVLVHGHGEDCMLYEGMQVREGVKYLMRTDVMYSLR